MRPRTLARALAVVVVGIAAATMIVKSDVGSAAAKKIYSGTLYIAGMGGHFAKAEVTIDPSDQKQPIKVNQLGRIVVGNKTSYPLHDPRVDVKDRTKMYWSTYHSDPNGQVHVGVSDLKTGEVIKDVALDLDPRAAVKSSVYCASGQAANSYLPVTMTDEAYIDVFDKATLALKHRVFLDYKPGETKFYHGTNSPDMKTFLVAVNRVDAGNPNGKIDLILLDLPQLENGKVQVLAKNTIEGSPGDTISFRQYFSNDGKRIYQSGADRLLVIDTATLKLISNAEMPDGTEVHDAMPTPDDKYVLLSVRNLVAASGADGKELMDGSLMLYDVAASQIIGRPVSVCAGCHEPMGLHKSVMLCGIDANWKSGSKMQ